MTREEALQRIADNNFAGEYGFDLQILIDCMVVAREIILDLQSPSEDCISRQAVLAQIDQWAIGNREYLYPNAVDYLTKRIQDIPPVTPKPKIGYWIGDKCSECENERAWYGCNPKYCPDCGAKMEE